MDEWVKDGEGKYSLQHADSLVLVGYDAPQLRVAFHTQRHPQVAHSQIYRFEASLFFDGKDVHPRLNNQGAQTVASLRPFLTATPTTDLRKLIEKDERLAPGLLRILEEISSAGN